MTNIVSSDRPLAVVDCEVYANYFLFKARRVDNSKIAEVAMYEGLPLDVDRIRAILSRYEIVTFNGRNFDIPIIYGALKGFSCEKLKAICDAIIQGNMKSWDIEREFNFKIPRDLKHIDLIEVAPGDGSLKIYGGRIHSRKMQDLPIEPSALITPDQYDGLALYCGNDLEVTEGLLRNLTPQLELRRAMSTQYGMDLMSKSDAQIAEAVIKQEITELNGYPPSKPVGQAGRSFNYDAPAWMRFESEIMWKVFNTIVNTPFKVALTGKVTIPELIADLEIKIGDGVYRMGIGGLHSSESSVCHIADEDTQIVDRDVASYYPTIILNNGIYPEGLGAEFLTIYGKIVKERLAAKKAGNKTVADTYKILLNGTFGKLGNKYSILYSPKLLIQVTVTGQLALLMFIERLHAEGFEVISANTDGIVIKCPRARKDELQAVVSWWEGVTSFETEETRYKALFSRDVNSYVALYENGKPGKYAKTKGEYADAGLQKNPANEICTKAVIEYLVHGTPIEATIMSCNDVRKFVTVRRVQGGAVYGGEVVTEMTRSTKEAHNYVTRKGQKVTREEAGLPQHDVHDEVFTGFSGETYLGKAVRWVYSTISEGAIFYKSNGNKVAKSDGAFPMMELPEGYAPPWHLDRQWYIREANSMLVDMGTVEDNSRWSDHLL